MAEIAFDELTARFAAIDEDDVVNRVRALSHAYVAFAVERPELFRTMFLFPPELPVVAPTGEELPAATKAFQVSLTAIEEAIATGRFAPTEPVAAGMTVWTVTHGAATVLLMGFGADDAAARDTLVTNAIEAVIRGLSAGDA